MSKRAQKTRAAGLPDDHARVQMRLDHLEEIRKKAHAVFNTDEWRVVAFPKAGDTITLVYGDAYADKEPAWPQTAVVQIEDVDKQWDLRWPHRPGAAWGGTRADAGITWVPGVRPEAVAAMLEAARALVALNKAP